VGDSSSIETNGCYLHIIALCLESTNCANVRLSESDQETLEGFTSNSHFNIFSDSKDGCFTLSESSSVERNGEPSSS
jgi:hypothetical protein